MCSEHGGTPRAGTVALAVLASETQLTVLGGGSAAIYLRAENGQIIWLGAPRTPEHRRAIVLPSVPRLAPGEPVTSRSGALRHGDRMLVDLAVAAVWLAPLLDQRDLASSAEQSRRLRTLTALSGVPSSAALPAMAIPVSANRATDQAVVRFMSTAAEPLKSARQAVRAGDVQSAVGGVLALVGLGPGLTPSGDDVAGGFLFALAVRPPFVAGRTESIRRERIEAAVEGVRHETHPISFTLLRDFAEGHGPAPLHDLAIELLSARSLGPTVKTVRRVLAIGHHSGSDLLTGFVAGMAGESGPVSEE